MCLGRWGMSRTRICFRPARETGRIQAGAILVPFRWPRPGSRTQSRIARTNEPVTSRRPRSSSSTRGGRLDAPEPAPPSSALAGEQPSIPPRLLPLVPQGPSPINRTGRPGVRPLLERASSARKRASMGPQEARTRILKRQFVRRQAKSMVLGACAPWGCPSGGQAGDLARLVAVTQSDVVGLAGAVVGPNANGLLAPTPKALLEG